MDELVFYLVIGIAVAIGSLIKAQRDKKEREERIRRLKEDGPKPRRRPVRTQTPKPVSALEEVRRFFEEVQQKGRREREGREKRKPLPSRDRAKEPEDRRPPSSRERAKEPEDRRKPLPGRKPAPVRRRAPAPVQPPPRVRRVRRVAQPPEKVIPVLEEAVPEPVRERVAPVAAAAAEARLAPERHVKRRRPTLARILASRRPELAKAVLLTEILTKPVAFRRQSRVPRFRL